MSEPKLISPLLDGFKMGSPMSSHDGVTCFPAIKENSENKYIIKSISIPASQVQLDALLLTGAYKDPADAMDYFKQVADGIVKEAEFLQRLGKLDGFLPFESWEVVPMEQGKLGYHIHLIGSYKRSLEKYMRRNLMTHLEAVNLGLDLCQALAICRRAGALYVDLKPTNVFISKGKEYRIGDLGFVDLDALQYTSLPGKYRSPYAPPETHDDLKTLNDTADTYAVGMILYQIYNDGTLPAAPKEPTDAFPSPANADYEIAEIIMKAVAPNPKDRWHDPMEMGQALVAYMQRNTVNNTPIKPPSANIIADPPIIDKAQKPEEPAYMDGIIGDAPVPAEMDATDAEVPEAVSSMFDQPYEVLPPEVPEDAALPEETETPEAESAAPIEEKEEPSDPDDEDDDDFTSLLYPDYEAQDPAEEDTSAEVTPPEKPIRERKPRKHIGKGWILPVVLILILALLVGGGVFFYQSFYLQSIDGLTVDGSQSQITVTVDTDTDHSLLTVICTDTYGNAIRKVLENGQAVFTDLLPNSQYKIQLEISGFHKLVGKTTDVFNTEAQTSVVSFTAVTGPEDGSLMLNFAIDGAEPDEWTVFYSTEGEEELSQSFTGHNVTVRGLTVGKQYTFRLDSSEDLELLGQTTLEMTASSLIMAKDLTIVSCENGNMTVRWSAPEDAAVESWSVRCYNDTGFEQQLTADTATEVVFTDIDSSKAYTVEVTAAGMTQPARVSVTANPVTVTGLSVNEEDPEKLTVSWEFDGNAPEGGWLLMYTLNGNSTPSVVKCNDASGVITPRIHGATYHFEIQTADSTSVFNSIQTYNCPNATVFDENSLSAEKLTAHLLETPDKENWSYKDITAADYASQFTSGQKISLLLHASVNFYIPEEEIRVMYVIRNSEGNVVSDLVSRETLDWYSMWINDDYHYCELDIPAVPTEPGDYSLSLYFNGYAVCVITFSIVE